MNTFEEVKVRPLNHITIRHTVTIGHALLACGRDSGFCGAKLIATDWQMFNHLLALHVGTSSDCWEIHDGIQKSLCTLFQKIKICVFMRQLFARSHSPLHRTSLYLMFLFEKSLLGYN